MTKYGKLPLNPQRSQRHHHCFRPTGSGKSTTLASALREKDSGELNIVTAEDPIEYDLGGNIQQFPVIRAKTDVLSAAPHLSAARP